MLLAAAGNVETLEGRQPSPVGEGWEAREQDPCEGGIYRPFTLIRQFKLATAYFVNPALPDTAKIRYAYSLDDFGDEDLSELIQSGGAQLAVFVDNDVAEALAPVHWEPTTSTRDQRPVINPCRPLSGTASDAPKMNLSWRDVDTPAQEDASELFQIPRHPRIRLLSGEALTITNTDADDRFVTWDPTEGVVVVKVP